MQISVLKAPDGSVTMLYARYVLEVCLGRYLRPGHCVDHIDGNRLNDMPENLQEITEEENSRKAHLDPIKMWQKSKDRVEMVCLACGQTFIKKMCDTHLAKGGHATYCSRRCSFHSARHQAKNQEYKLLEESPQPSFERKCPDWLMYSEALPSNDRRHAHGMARYRCKECGKDMQSYSYKQFCSLGCTNKWKTGKHTKIDLESLPTVLPKAVSKEISWLAAGKLLGVSDNAARKWARKLGLM